MTPLVLLHGALFSAASLAPLAAALAPSRDVIALDLPGHGGTPVPDTMSVESLGDAVLAALDARGVTAAHLVGYSLGGYVALDLARRAPDRVRSVLAHATKLAWEPEVATRETRGLDPARVRERAPGFAADLDRWHAPQDWGLLMARVAGLLADLGARPPLGAEAFAAIARPALLSVGDRDKLVTLEETVAAYRALPAGRLAVRPNLGHPLDAAAQAALAPEVLAFVQAVEAG